MTIGIGVEGPSDRIFWEKLLRRRFRRVNFHVWNMGNRHRLIREAPRLIETFRGAHFHCVFIIVDRNDTPCVSAVFEEFDPAVRVEARRPLPERSVFVCVAIKELEAWYLADGQAINNILPRSLYTEPPDTATMGAERELKRLWSLHYNTAFNKLDFAAQMAAAFDPQRAQRHSKSFTYFWSHLLRQVP